MSKFKLLVFSLVAAIMLTGVYIALPSEIRSPQAQATTGHITECPPPTEKGEYFSRGIGKDGNISCGFTFYNACAYYEGAEAGTPECERNKPTEEQMKPWQPEATTEAPVINSYEGGK